MKNSRQAQSETPDYLKKLQEIDDGGGDALLVFAGMATPTQGPATQQQIRYVYVLLKQAGYDPGEFRETHGDFHKMNKGEISELIEALQGKPE